MDSIETLIIGGGQAGLAMSYHLGQRGVEHLVLERARVAERWRTQRWDSLMFQFPNWSIELPGHAYARNDPDAFSHKDEIVRFIEDYATWMRAPLRTGVNVLRLQPASKAGRYRVITDRGDFEARAVVVATGPYQRPRLPLCSAGFPADVLQVHAGDYRTPAGLLPGAVLVVGTGASGCQIADELAASGRPVFFSVGRHHRVPRRYRGRDVFWWRRALGHLDQIATETSSASRVPAPLVTGVDGGRDIDLRAYSSRGVTLVGRVLDVRDGRVALAPDLQHNLRVGDESFERFTRDVDEYVVREGLDAPLDAANRRAESAKDDTENITGIDLATTGIRSVIWATGYSLDFDWIDLPIFDEQRRPIHRRGVTPSPGIYLLGLAWLHKRKSSFLYGVGEDAGYISEHMALQHSPAGYP